MGRRRRLYIWGEGAVQLLRLLIVGRRKSQVLKRPKKLILKRRKTVIVNVHCDDIAELTEDMEGPPGTGKPILTTVQSVGHVSM